MLHEVQSMVHATRRRGYDKYCQEGRMVNTTRR